MNLSEAQMQQTLDCLGQTGVTSIWKIPASDFPVNSQFQCVFIQIVAWLNFSLFLKFKVLWNVYAESPRIRKLLFCFDLWLACG